MCLLDFLERDATPTHELKCTHKPAVVLPILEREQVILSSWKILERTQIQGVLAGASRIFLERPHVC